MMPQLNRLTMARTCRPRCIEAMVSGAVHLFVDGVAAFLNAQKTALDLDDPDADHLAEAIEDLVDQQLALRSDFNKMAWQDYPFNGANLGHCIDSARAKL